MAAGTKKQTGKASGESKQDGARAIPYSKVKRERVDWFWDGLIPYGMLTLLAGDPGLGKSLLTVHLAGKASRAGVSSILLSAEDHKGATIRPRLEAAKARLTRVHHVEVRRDGLEDGLWLPDDGDELDELIARTGSKLVIVDPLTAHLDENINSWSDQSVRRAMEPLRRSAEKHGCAVMIVAHLNKGAGHDPLHRTGGSIGIPATVRSALLLARDPGDPDGERGRQRILAHIKCNVGPTSPSQACEVGSVAVGRGKDLIEAPLLEIVGESEVSGQELLDADRESQTQRQDAEEFLVEELADGSRTPEEIRQAAKNAGHSWRTIERAKTHLGIASTRVGGKGGKGKSGGGKGRWEWSL